MNCLLDVLARAGVPKAHTRHRWPVDVVTQVLRDHVGSALPIRSGISEREAATMKRRIERQETGGWYYEVSTHRSERGTYTVTSVATRARARKLASLKRDPFRKVPIDDDELQLDSPEVPVVQDTRGNNHGQ